MGHFMSDFQPPTPIPALPVRQPVPAPPVYHGNAPMPAMNDARQPKAVSPSVSYTHLTLPTIYSV